MQDALKSLFCAVRPRVLIKYLGLLAIMLAILTLAPLLVSVYFFEYELSGRYFLVISLLLIVGLPSLRMEHPTDVQSNESLAITALAFITAPLIMIYPMMGAGLSFIDAWFEAVSAVTTTGLTTITDLTMMPHTFIFARAWMQWYGGLGIVVLSVAILMHHTIALKRLINPTSENMLTTTRIYARRMLAVYVVLTLIGLSILMLLLDDAFIALTYTLAAISTGGFSPLDSSLVDLHWTAQFGITLLGLFGALPFILYYWISRGDWREFVNDMEVRAFLGLTLLLCISLTVSLMVHSQIGWQEALRHGTLLGISAQSTTGFASISLDTLTPFSLVLLMIAMFIGGAVGSTAGGIKILRFLILLRLIQLALQRTALPSHAVVEPRLGERTLESKEIERSLMLILFFGIVLLISWLFFLSHGHDPLRSLFEVVSATGTVGLSSGLTSPELQPILKGVLCIDMLMGRLEVITLLIVLYPGTWQSRC